MKARYRKHNDGSQSSSTYHKKDGTPVRAILKKETRELTKEALELVEIGVPVDLRTRSTVYDQPPRGYDLLPHGERVQTGDLIQLRLATSLEVSWHWMPAPDDLVGLKINRRTKSFARKKD